MVGEVLNQEGKNLLVTVGATGDLTFTATSGTNTISTGSTAGVARALHFDILIAVGGGAGAALDYQFKLNSVLQAGLLADTDGAGGSQNPVWAIPYYVADYGGAFVAPPNPAPANITNGCMFVAHDTNGAGDDALFIYSNGAWLKIDTA